MNIAFRVNMTLSVAKLSGYIRIHRLNYTQKDNLSFLMAPASTSRMLLPHHWELVLNATRQIDQNITDATGDQR